MKHIAIGGLSFCGSTVTSYILGSLDGCGTIGESHWLVDNVNTDTRIYCSHCGPKCEYWDEAFRQSLSENPQDWYVKLADRLAVSTLISSDKTPLYLDKFDPARTFDLLVLYKPPQLHARSHANVIERNGSQINIAKYLDHWSAFYERLMNQYPVRGQTLFVNAQRLYEKAEERFGILADALGYSFSTAALSYWKRVHHAVGGNFNPYSWVNSDTERLRIAPLKRHPLSQELLLRAASHNRANATFSELEERSLKF